MLKNAASLIFSLTLLFVVALPLHAQTPEQSVQVKVSPTEFSDPLGSFVQGEIELSNTSDQEINLKLGVGNDQSQKIGSNMTGFFGSLRFYGDLPEDFESLLNDSNGSVSKACEKRDDSNDLDNWCDGEKVFTITLEAEQKISLPYTFRIPLTVQATNAFLLVESVAGQETQQEVTQNDTSQDTDNQDQSGQDDTQDQDLKTQADGTQIFAQQLQYTPPKITIISSEIRELKLKRSFGKLNFWSWMRAGFRETYQGGVTIENTGNEKVPYNLTLNIQRPDEEAESIERSGEIAQGEQVVEVFDAIAMPRLGTALIDAQLSYDGNDGPQSTQTDQARVANTPLKEIVGFVFFGLALLIGFVIFRKTRDKTQDESFPEESGRSRFKKQRFSSEQSGRDLQEDQEFQYQRQGQKFNQEESMPAVETKKVVRKKEKVATSKSAVRHVSKKSVSLEQQTQEVYEDENLSPSRGPSPLVVKGLADDTQRSHKMDMDWIGEDDAAFDSAMRLQERTMNMKVGALVLGVVAVCLIALLFLGNKYFFSTNKDDGVSIADLNEQTKDTPSEIIQDLGDTEQETSEQKDDTQSESDSENSAEPEIISEDQSQEEEEVVDTIDINVQVLNAGSTAGAAGELTKALEAKGYKVLPATNAKNDYVGNVVYHATAKENTADKLIDDIGSEYGTVDIEEAQFVLDMYNADLVVVLGS